MNSDNTLKSSTKPRSRRWVRGAVAIVVGAALGVVIYAGGLLVAVPLVAERALARYANAVPGRSAGVEAVRVNPFSLEVTLTGAQAQDAGTAFSFVAPRLLLNFSSRSLAERRLVFDTVLIERPELQLEVPTELTALRERLAGLRIARLEIRDGEMQLGDGMGERQLALHSVAMVGSALDGRRPGGDAVDAGRYTLHAGFGAGGELGLDGVLAGGLSGTSGQVTLSGLVLEALGPWLGPQLSSLAARGTLDLTAEYALSATPTVLEIIDGGAEFRDLELKPAEGFVVHTPRLDALVSAIVTRSDSGLDARGRIELTGASFELSDRYFAPTSTFALADVSGVVSTETGPAQMNLAGRLVDGGPTMLNLRPPGTADAGRTVTLELAAIPLALLAPYAEHTVARGLTAGRTDIGVYYTQHGERIDGRAQIAARGVEFAASEGANDAGDVELAAALLEDASGLIEIELPLAASASTRAIGAAVADALDARVAALADAPFAALAPIAGRDAERLHAIAFEPGGAGLTAAALDTLESLALTLRARPRLGLRVLGGFDAGMDRDALAKQQIELHVLLATAGPSPQARPAPVDFASPRARDVLDEFAAERLPAARRAEIAARFACEGALIELCRSAYYAAVFDALVANESIANSTLTRLGRFRAQAVATALAELGIATDRVEVGNGTPLLLPSAVGLPVEVRVARPDAQQ
jgi:hypothetical protein